jgi:hypothetical protein
VRGKIGLNNSSLKERNVTASAQWICPVCNRPPRVLLVLGCPSCEFVATNSITVDFHPTGAVTADHEAHLAVESSYVRRQDTRFRDEGEGDFSLHVPEFFKEHIKEHEQWAFDRGAASRDKEIRDRIEELNTHAQTIVAELTETTLSTRQQTCEHACDRRWLRSAEAGRLHLVCDGCYKVIGVKFVGTASQRGEAVGLKIVTEK